jgi:MGT family glycosyltransferase
MHFAMAGVTAPGHIYPGLAVIDELVSRGHRVSYLVGEQLAELVTPTGAEAVTYESAMPRADDNWPEDAGAAMQLFLDESMTALASLHGVSDVDAVLYDIGGFAGRVAAVGWGVPAVQLSPSMVAWEGYEEEMAEHTEALKASENGARYFAMLRAWLDEHGVDIDEDAFLGRPDACVVLIPRVLQPNAERVSDRYVFAGPCIDATRAGIRLEDLDGLRDAVDAALARTGRARELQVEVRACGSAARAADAVERLSAASG